MGDDKFTVPVTFWGEKTTLADTLSVGDVVAFRDFSLNDYQVDKLKHPMNINFKDTIFPHTKMDVLSPDDVPEHLRKNIEDHGKPIFKGVIVDVSNLLRYLSCPGWEGRCRVRADQNSLCFKCKNDPGVNPLFEDYRCKIVLQEEKSDEILHFTAFR